MNTALLLIDIQNDYFENGANPLVNSIAACNKAKLILNDFREKNLPVIHIQHIATRPGSTFFVPGTLGAEIHANLAPLDSEKVIIKHFPNSFRETELLAHLNIQSIKQLVICGMMTHMCVDATVRAAKDYGFDITLIGDACATKDQMINEVTVTASNVQNSFLAALSYFYSNVITTNQYLGL